PESSKGPIMSHWTHLLLGCFICQGAGLCLAASADPSCYVRESTWHESLLASLEAAAGANAENGFAPFESDTMLGGDAARPIRVPIETATELYLFVTGVPDAKWAVADWADARLIRPD